MTSTDYAAAHEARLASLAANAPPLFHTHRTAGGRTPRPVVSDRGERFNSVRDAAAKFDVSGDTIRKSMAEGRACAATGNRKWRYATR